MAHTVLVVDDEASICRTLKSILADEGYEVLLAGEGTTALKLVAEEHPDVVLLDIWMPGMDGLETLARLKEVNPELEVIMISGHGTIETAVQATKLGAYDFIQKPLDLHKILITIQNALAHHRLEEENLRLKMQLKEKHRMVGDSPLMKELKAKIELAAPSHSWILITGENGTGKELVARAVHQFSQRAGEPFVEVNCAAIPEELIESELFGHEKGAFTGATGVRRGKFELAHRGTILLDEIGDMSLKTQAKILRVLEEKSFSRIGGSRLLKVDVRVIAATNKDLEDEIKAGRFREDLYYRVNVIPLHVPPLRERNEDIPDLVHEFLNEIAIETGRARKEITPRALEALKTYTWPGNVRELKNTIERLIILTPGKLIDLENIPAPIKPASPATEFEPETLKAAKTQFEKDYILKKLAEFEGNIARTAEAIGLERTYLYRKLKSYGIEVP